MIGLAFFLRFYSEYEFRIYEYIKNSVSRSSLTLEAFVSDEHETNGYLSLTQNQLLVFF